MKKILTALALLAVAGTASAQWHHDRCCYRGGYYAGGNWMAPLIIGGVIGYELNRPQVIVEQQPVYVQSAPVIVSPVQQPPVGYHWQQMIDPQTNTTKIVLVPN